MHANPKSVLLVDDHETMRRLAQTTLELTGYTVRVSENGQQAIDLLSGWTPDLIILGMMMRVLDGFEFLAWRNQHCPAIPVLALTGMDQEDGKSRILDAGATGVLIKPVTPTRLLATIAQLVGVTSVTPSPE